MLHWFQVSSTGRYLLMMLRNHHPWLKYRRVMNKKMELSWLRASQELAARIQSQRGWNFSRKPTLGCQNYPLYSCWRRKMLPSRCGRRQMRRTNKCHKNSNKCVLWYGVLFFIVHMGRLFPWWWSPRYCYVCGIVSCVREYNAIGHKIILYWTGGFYVFVWMAVSLEKCWVTIYFELQP